MWLFITLSLFLSPPQEDFSPTSESVVQIVELLESRSIIHADNFFISNKSEKLIVWNLDLAFYYSHIHQTEKAHKYRDMEEEALPQNLPMDVPKPYRKRIIDKRHKVRISQVRKVEGLHFIVAMINDSNEHGYKAFFVFDSDLKLIDADVSEFQL